MAKEGSSVQRNQLAALAIVTQQQGGTLTKAAAMQQIMALGYYLEEAREFLKSVTTT